MLPRHYSPGTLISVKTSGSHMGTNTVSRSELTGVLDEFRELKTIAHLKSERIG